MKAVRFEYDGWSAAKESGRYYVPGDPVDRTGDYVPADVAGDLLASCLEALDTLRVAVAAGLDGFPETEAARIAEDHVTVRRLKAAIAAAEGR